MGPLVGNAKDRPDVTQRNLLGRKFASQLDRQAGRLTVKAGRLLAAGTDRGHSISH